MPEAQGDQQLLRKAHHEAAHAAVAFRLEIPVDFVTIRPETRLLECGRITGEEARAAFFSQSAEGDGL